MKAIVALLGCLSAISGLAQQAKLSPTASNEVIHVATAMDHLTVIEFGEPVTMAAAGSNEFQVERYEDKVFVKPLRQGAATDLFVWTASRRFAYELESPGEVKDMNFALDERAKESIATAQPSLEDVADTLLIQALLGAQRIDNSSIKDERSHPTARVEQIFRTRNTTYIHYSIKNSTERRFEIPEPAACEVDALQPKVSPLAFHRFQLNDSLVRRLGVLHFRPLQIVKSQVQRRVLDPGEETQGVITVREQLASSAIVQLVFGPFNAAATATVVF